MYALDFRGEETKTRNKGMKMQYMILCAVNQLLYTTPLSIFHRSGWWMIDVAGARNFIEKPNIERKKIKQNT